MYQPWIATSESLIPKIGSRPAKKAKNRTSLGSLLLQCLPREWYLRRSMVRRNPPSIDSLITDQSINADNSVLSEEDKIELYSRPFDPYS